jgi:hypothetical protein
MRDSPDVARDQQAQFGFLGLVNHTHATTAKFLDDAGVEGKSPKSWELAVAQEDNCCNIAITLIVPGCFRPDARPNLLDFDPRRSI